MEIEYKQKLDKINNIPVCLNKNKYKELISNNVLSGKLHDECMLDQAVLPW